MAVALATCILPPLIADEAVVGDSAERNADQHAEAVPFLSSAEPVREQEPASRAQTISSSTTLNEQPSSSSRSLPQATPREIGDTPRQIGKIRPSFQYAWGDVEESTLPEDFDRNTDDRAVSRVIGTPMLLQWQPTNLWYHPLYFEDAPLERYGHTYSSWIQPLVSTGRFVGQAVTLPYHATLRPAKSREYPLGWYRPGECTPHLKYRLTWNDEAAINQALAVVGLVFLIP